MSANEEPIENVIERCRFRIDRSLDCNVGDIIRLIDEVERSRQRPRTQHQLPSWYGMGSGD
jgi:hypothetical protein